jgi:hypothetical protein
MDDALARFRARMGEFGIAMTDRSIAVDSRGTWRGEVHLARGASKQDYALLYGPKITFTDIAKVDFAGPPALVFTTFVGPRTAETLRRAGVQYVDTVGNAWVTFGDVLVDVRGRLRTDHVPAARTAAGNLFSVLRAQVICALLTWPSLWDATRREIAYAAGVSLGQAHNTMALLAEAGYEADQGRPEQTQLLDLWAAAFPTGLAAKLTLAAFHGDIEKLVSLGMMFVSGEKAAEDLLRPATLTLYVEQLDPRLPIVNRWRADGRPNILIRRKFWHSPDGDKSREGLAVAPWPLVYADLLASDDSRVRGAATEWKDRHARSA